MKFNRWVDFFQRARNDNKTMRKLSDQAVYGELSEAARGGGIATLTSLISNLSRHAISSDICWRNNGRPYYKVWPSIASSLSCTSLNFDTSYLHAPYPAFEVTIGNYCHSYLTGSFLVTFVQFGNEPSDPEFDWDDLGISDPEERAEYNEQRDLDTKYRVGLCKKRGKRAIGQLNIGYMIHGNLAPRFNMGPSSCGPIGASTQMLLFRDSTPSEDLEFWNPTRSPESPIWVSDYKKILSVVIGVMMFGIHNHELVMPDIKTPVIEGRGKKKKVLQEQAERAAAKECNGWLVGSEIDLPQPEVVGSTCVHPGTGTPLKFGHVRSGHMKMQPCGPKNQDRKLIFVDPTVVRPDLPVRKSHGYRIKDSLIA